MSWTVDRGGGQRIVVIFDGHLSVVDGERAAEEFIAAVGRDACDIIWDVRAMTGYDSGARKAWQRRIFAVRHQIRSLTLVGGSSLVRMGASAIALVLGIDCRFAATPPTS